MYKFSQVVHLKLGCKLEGQKYSDDEMCDDICHILILQSDPINRLIW